MITYTNRQGETHSADRFLMPEELPASFQGDALLRVQDGDRTLFDAAKQAAPTEPAPEPAPTEPTPEPAPAVVSSPVFSDYGHTTIDASAKARIDAQQEALRSAGFRGIGFKGEGGDGGQFFANGTRMAADGYATQGQRAADFKTQRLARDVADELSARVQAERRGFHTVSARELADALSVNGKLTAFGYLLTEQSIRGLAGRLDSPMLGYVLGLRERIQASYNARASVPATLDDAARVTAMAAYTEAMHSDRAKIADVLAHECKRNPDVRLKLRVRENPHDVFAIVSPAYAPADWPEVRDQILKELPADARGSFTYDANATAWELRAEVWTPTPVDEQAVGEAFRGYVSFQSRDNGTSRFRGGGGIELLRCLNASTYLAEGSEVARKHIGAIMADVAAMMSGSVNAIHALCAAWGVQREAVVTVPEKVTIEQAIPGFWRSLLTDTRALAGVLPGGARKHVEPLTAAFFSERRDADRLVRADFAQGWTRYIQDQPTEVRRDAEAAIGRWLVKDKRPLRCDLPAEKEAN